MIEFDRLRDNQTVYTIAENTVIPVVVSPVMQNHSLTDDQIPCRRFSFTDDKEGISQGRTHFLYEKKLKDYFYTELEASFELCSLLEIAVDTAKKKLDIARTQKTLLQRASLSGAEMQVWLARGGYVRSPSLDVILERASDGTYYKHHPDGNILPFRIPVEWEFVTDWEVVARTEGQFHYTQK